MRLIVDRIEEGIAVCSVYDDEDRRIEVPIRYLPPEIREGDHLTLTFAIDPLGKESEMRKAEELLRELTKNQDPNKKKFKL
jgi:hypothetical protein